MNTCPSCNKDWKFFKDKTYFCTLCNTSYYIGGDGELDTPILYYDSIIQMNDRLDYYFREGACLYHKPSLMYEYFISSTKLPMLPLQMTIDKLKLYLLFS